MGMKEAFQNAAVAAFSAAGNIKTSVTYHSTGTNAYNTSTGAMTETGGQDLSVSVMFTNYEQEEIDGDVILTTDQKALIPTLNLSVTPKITDTIIAGSETWQVQGKKTDPAEAMWEIQLRKP